MKQQRKHHTAEEKVAILRRHFLEKVPIPDMCEQTGLHQIGRPSCLENPRPQGGIRAYEERRFSISG